MNYSFERIAAFSEGTPYIALESSMVSNIVIDHREAKGDGVLFAAIQGSRVNGHSFIPKLLEIGVRNFLVTEPHWAKELEGQANVILVDNTIHALQHIASKHREQSKAEIVAITGSNGKTIIKEWLNMLLEDEYNICRSPKSYNSQLGVPLSLFQLEPEHNLGVFEAGISKPGEMLRLAETIQPNTGLLSNIGDAHAAHFESQRQKFDEKWQLFKNAEHVICCKDQHWYQWISSSEREKCFTWSRVDKEADVFVMQEESEEGSTAINVSHHNHKYSIQIPFVDFASIENALHCLCFLIFNQNAKPAVLSKFSQLTPVAMRMEVKKGIGQSVLIDDSYNADLRSLKAALQQLFSYRERDKLVILSDLSDNQDPAALYAHVAGLLKEYKVDRVVGIGQEIEAHRSFFRGISTTFYSDIEAFWSNLNVRSIRDSAILLKGSRTFKLEQLARKLQAEQHETLLEIDLQKMTENLNYFRSKLNGQTKMMVMVKAFAYGSGSGEIANLLQRQKIDYLGVAYVDEGVALRNKGVGTPIMVMSPELSSYETILRHDLEPEIFSMASLRGFIEVAKRFRHLRKTFNIHLKLDTGMHRLGFEKGELKQVAELIKGASFIKVHSAFTHLSASDDKMADEFTHHQIALFKEMTDALRQELAYDFLRHCLNSTGIVRFPQYQFEMVRLGIGLYGFTGSDHNKYVHALGTLKSYISQIREVKAGDIVGYALQGAASQDRRIATVSIGYADGLDRRLGNGKWHLKWQGITCPTVGNICMDMCMIDVSHTNAKEGDDIIVFQGGKEVEEMAAHLGTIPYEILTKISQRVRRVFLQE